MNTALPKVKALYKSGDVAPFETSAKPDENSGASGELPTESACSATALRKAIATSDDAFLEGLAGKTVVVEGMVLSSPKAQGDLAIARIMAGGGTLSVAFPPETKAASLPMATRIIVTGVAVKANGSWLVRAQAWGKVKDVKSGQPMNICIWSKVPASGADAGK